MELLPFEFPRLRNLDHDARMDLVDERNSSSPDPMHSREFAADIHDKKRSKFYVFQREGERRIKECWGRRG